jgi:hypothetical protein
MLSIARISALVKTNRLNVPVTEAKPSPLKNPGGTEEVNVEVETRFAFSNACTVRLATPPAVAKSKDAVLRSEDNDTPSGPD